MKRAYSVGFIHSLISLLPFPALLWRRPSEPEYQTRIYWVTMVCSPNQLYPLNTIYSIKKIYPELIAGDKYSENVPARLSSYAYTKTVQSYKMVLLSCSKHCYRSLFSFAYTGGLATNKHLSHKIVRRHGRHATVRI